MRISAIGPVEWLFLPRTPQLDRNHGCRLLESNETLGELIDKSTIKSCESLKQEFFRDDCEMKEIRGFKKCSALERIQTPASVAMINEEAFAKAYL
jgi:hypothetical protein